MPNVYQTGIIPSTANYTTSVVSNIYRNGNRSSMRNNIEKYRLRLGMTREELAAKLGTTATTIYRKERGNRQLKIDELTSYAAALNCNPGDLVKGNTSLIPVLGSVGAGEDIIPIDDLPLTNGLREHEYATMNCDFVEPPPEGYIHDVIALRVRGDSMEPAFYEGDVIYYTDVIRAGFDKYLNKRVVCGLKDGRAFVKVLKRGTIFGHYRLESFNAKDIEDVELEWCARVCYVRTA